MPIMSISVHVQSPSNSSSAASARTGIRGGLCVGDGYASDRWKTAEVISNIGSTAGILYLRDYVTYEDNTTEPIRTLILPYPAFYGGAPTVMQRGTGLFAMASDDERRNRAAALFAVWMTCGQSNSRFAVQTGYLPVTQKGFAELLSNSDTLENEKYRLLYDTVGDMYDDYAFCSQPRYEGAADVQAALEKNVKRVLSSAHAEYDKRVMLGGDAHSIADELESRALDELRGLLPCDFMLMQCACRAAQGRKPYRCAAVWPCILSHSHYQWR